MKRVSLGFLSYHKNLPLKKDLVSNVHTFEGRNYLLDTTVENLENELDPQKFFRINRKFIISLHAHKGIVVYCNSRLKLTLKSYKEKEIILSRKRVGEFKNWLE